MGLDVLIAGSSRPRRLHTAFDVDGAEALREILHQDPRNFGKEETFWTLEYASGVSFQLLPARIVPVAIVQR
jgi:hypothetical protein